MNFKNFQLLAFRLLYLTYDDIINCAEHIIDKWTLINDFHHLPGTLLDLHDWVNRKLRQVSGVKLRLQPATLLNVTLFHGCFSRFLNYTEVPNCAKRLTLLRTSEWRQLTSFWCLCWALWAYLAHKSFFFFKPYTKKFQLKFYLNASNCSTEKRSNFCGFYENVYRNNNIKWCWWYLIFLDKSADVDDIDRNFVQELRDLRNFACDKDFQDLHKR